MINTKLFIKKTMFIDVNIKKKRSYNNVAPNLTYGTPIIPDSFI